MPYAVHITYNFFYFSDGGEGHSTMPSLVTP